jgi:beta-lactamase class A
MRWLFALAMALATLFMVPAAIAGDKEIAAIKAVLAPGAVDTQLFASSFLQQVPPGRLKATVAKVKAQIGPVLSVEGEDPHYTVDTAGYRMPVDITLDPSGKIVGLLFRPPVAKAASADDLLRQLTGLAPESAWLVTRNGEPINSHNPDQGLAVGSAFKLGILKALKDEIAAGKHSWTEVVTLQPEDVSLPSGILQTWPSGSALTVHSLAALMISMSDNTAADALLHLVGREEVEQALGLPLVLTTREVFVLKANADARKRFLAASTEGRKAMLPELDLLPLPSVASVIGPYQKGIEYDLSPAKLCALIEAVADLDVFAINPGVANRADWARLAYKGGSEQGVLSLTTQAVAKDGTRLCFSAVWNSPQAIDETKATSLYASALAKLAGP